MRHAFRLQGLFLVLLMARTMSAGKVPVGHAVESIRDEYLVQLYDDAPNVAQVAQQVAQQHGGRVLQVFPVFKSVLMRMTAAQADAMNGNPLVRSIQENAIMHAAVSSPQTGVDNRLAWPPSTTPASSWGLDRIDQVSPQSPRLDNSYSWCYDGHGVRIYVVDTGVLPYHPEFGGPDASRVVRPDALYNVLAGLPSPNTLGKSPCWEANGGRVFTPNSQHGTAVASIAAGGTLGVAKGATIVDARTMDCAGVTTAARLMTTIQWIIGDPDRGSLSVINISFNGVATGSSDEYSLANAIYTAANNYQIPVVCSAGNQGSNVFWYWPANSNGAITVAGLSKDSDIAWWVAYGYRVPPNYVGTNGGNTTSFYAPAQYIESASTCTPPIYNNAGQQVYIGCDVIPSHNLYRSEITNCSIGPDPQHQDPSGCTSGTSFAAAHMSGVIARYLQRFGPSSWTVIKNNLTYYSNLYGGVSINDPNSSFYSPVLVYRDCP